MIGMAAQPTPNTKVWKQGLFGFLPMNAIWEFSVEMAGDKTAYIRTLMTMFDAYGPPMKHPLDAARDVLLGCGSVAHVKAEIQRRYEKIR